MSLRKWLVTAGMVAAISAVAPRSASAEWVLTPFVGWNFNGSAEVHGEGGTEFSDKFEKKLNYGVSLAAGAGRSGSSSTSATRRTFLRPGRPGAGSISPTTATSRP